MCTITIGHAKTDCRFAKLSTRRYTGHRRNLDIVIVMMCDCDISLDLNLTRVSIHPPITTWHKCKHICKIWCASVAVSSITFSFGCWKSWLVRWSLRAVEFTRRCWFPRCKTPFSHALMAALHTMMLGTSREISWRNARAFGATLKGCSKERHDDIDTTHDRALHESNQTYTLNLLDNLV